MCKQIAAYSHRHRVTFSRIFGRHQCKSPMFTLFCPPPTPGGKCLTSHVHQLVANFVAAVGCFLELFRWKSAVKVNSIVASHLICSHVAYIWASKASISNHGDGRFLLKVKSERQTVPVNLHPPPWYGGPSTAVGVTWCRVTLRIKVFLSDITSLLRFLAALLLKVRVCFLRVVAKVVWGSNIW